MSDENGEGLFQSENGDPANGKGDSSSPDSSQPAEDKDIEGQPEFVTVDALNKKLNEFFETKVQSSRDKAIGSVSKRYQERIDKLQEELDHYKALGHPIPEEVAQKRRDKILHEALSSLGNEDDPSTPAGQQPSQDPEALRSKVNATANRLMQEAGIRIEQDDPELNLIDRTTTDPNAFLASLRNAIYQKSLRIGQIPNQSGSTPNARIPSSVTGTSKIPAGAQQQFIKEYLETKGKGMPAARAVREKWAAKGLPVDQIIHQINTGEIEV